MTKVKFYPANDRVPEWTKHPEPASKSLHQWYKESDSKQSFKEATIKKCMAIFDAMTAGYMLYFPCDVYIDATGDQLHVEIPYLVEQETLTAIHQLSQYEKYPLDTDVYHQEVFRLDPLWYVETDKGYSSMFLPPIHSELQPFRAMEAIIDTDKYISQGYLSIFIKKGFKGVIKQGTPFVQVIPFKREEFSMVLESTENYKTKIDKQLISFIPKFMGVYKDLFRSLKIYK